MLFPERLEKYQSTGLGLKRGDVRLAPYHPRWKRSFAYEAYLISDQLRIESLRLYHGGSTSIPDLHSKPIIDIVGSVADLDELEARKAKLEELGYEWKGEYGIEGRRYAVLYHPDRSTAFVHLHLYQNENPEIQKNLLFRDYLRATPSAAKEYESVKRELIEAGKSRDEYTDAKAPKIGRLLAEAEEWRKSPSQKASKVLVILSSSKGGKNTLDLVRKEYPSAEIEIVQISHEVVGPHVYGHEGGSPQDEFLGLIQKVIASDLTIFATPVYWYAMSGAMKDFFDRFSDLLYGPGKDLGEKLYGKKIRLISSGSDPRLPFGFEAPFVMTSIYFGMDYLGSTYLKY